MSIAQFKILSPSFDRLPRRRCAYLAGRIYEIIEKVKRNRVSASLPAPSVFHVCAFPQTRH
jgi:hypothetical protein